MTAIIPSPSRQLAHCGIFLQRTARGQALGSRGDLLHTELDRSEGTSQDLPTILSAPNSFIA